MLIQDNKLLSFKDSFFKQLNNVCQHDITDILPYDCSKPVERKMLLQNLTEVGQVFPLNFEDMIKLMSLCGQLTSPFEGNRGGGKDTRRALPNINPVTLLSGILPGNTRQSSG